MKRLGKIAVLIAVAAVQGCMAQPENGDAIPSTSTPVRFSGFWGAPGATVAIQSATSAGGPFRTFATAVSAREPVRIEGVRWYPWQVSAQVPAWSGTGCAAEAFVRARARGFNLLTFDDGGSGATGLECLLEELDAGASWTHAARACVSGDSPIVRLVAGGGTHLGDVTIATQAEADAIACHRRIAGSLTIADNPSALAIALPNLEQVTGDVRIVYSRESAPGSTPAVRSVSLPALTEVGGDLALEYPGEPSDLVTLDLGLERLTTVGGDVTIALTTFNAGLSGLDVLATIPGALAIESSGSDLSLFGLLPALTAVAGDVRVRNGLTLTGALEALVAVGGTVTVEDSWFNPGTSNFESLTEVGGDLLLLDLAALVTLEPFPHQFPALASLGGELAVVGATSFTDLRIGDAAGLAVGALRLDDNASLTALGPGHVTVESSGAIVITDNAMLCQATAEAFVSAQAAIGWSGTATLSGNATCP